MGLGAFVRRVVYVLRLLCPQRQCLGDKEHCSGVADAVAVLRADVARQVPCGLAKHVQRHGQRVGIELDLNPCTVQPIDPQVLVLGDPMKQPGGVHGDPDWVLKGFFHVSHEGGQRC